MTIRPLMTSTITRIARLFADERGLFVVQQGSDASVYNSEAKFRFRLSDGSTLTITHTKD